MAYAIWVQERKLKEPPQGSEANTSLPGLAARRRMQGFKVVNCTLEERWGRFTAPHLTTHRLRCFAPCGALQNALNKFRKSGLQRALSGAAQSDTPT
jgi:hypothetical protein